MYVVLHDQGWDVRHVVRPLVPIEELNFRKLYEEYKAEKPMDKGPDFHIWMKEKGLIEDVDIFYFPYDDH